MPIILIAVLVVLGLVSYFIGTWRLPIAVRLRIDRRFLRAADFALDVLKGLMATSAALVATTFLASLSEGVASATIYYPAVLTSQVLVTLGCSYSIFTRVRYGDGLGAVIGSQVLVFPLVLGLLGVTWVTGYFAIRRNYSVATMAAFLGSLVLLASLTNQQWLQILPEGLTGASILTTLLVQTAVVFVGNLEGVRAFFTQRHQQGARPKDSDD